MEPLKLWIRGGIAQKLQQIKELDPGKQYVWFSKDEALQYPDPPPQPDQLEPYLESLFGSWNEEKRAAFEICIDKTLRTHLFDRGSTHQSSPRTKSRRHVETKERLIKFIEDKIGRKIERRSCKPIDPRFSDRNPPNLYDWQFTSQYPSFPSSAIGRWTAQQQQSCIEALEKGYLTISILEPEDHNPQNQMLSDTAEDPGKLSTKNNGPIQSPHRDADLRDSSLVETPNIPPTMDGSQPEPVNLATCLSQIALKVKSEEESRLKAEAEIKNLQSVISTLQQTSDNFGILVKNHEAELKDLRLELERTRQKLQEVEVLAENREAEVFDLRIKLREQKILAQEAAEAKVSTMDTLLAQARSELEQSCRESILDDVGTERRLLLRGHLEHVQRIRHDFDQQLKWLREQHATELEFAKASARQEGREVASRELSLNDNSDLNPRKRRELKTIMQNWHDTLQNALPPGMLPENHAPGDRTLHLLARLSKEMDAQKAGILLRDEIDRRQEHLSESVRSYIITNSDIQKVIDQICPRSQPQSLDQNHRSISTESVAREQMRTPNTVPIVPSQRDQASNSTHHIRQIPDSIVEMNQSEVISETRLVSSQLLQTKSKICNEERNSRPYTSNPHSSANDRRNSVCTNSQNIQDYKTFLEELFGKIPTPASISFPSSLRAFPLDFLTEFVTDDESTFSVAKPAMLKKQLVPWPQLIIMNPKQHLFAPLQGEHGVLEFIDSRMKFGDPGVHYPVLLETRKGSFQYIGHYALGQSFQIPCKVWETSSLAYKKRIVARIVASTEEEAGRQSSLGDKRLDELIEGTLQQLEDGSAKSFCTILRLVSFEHDHYQKLESALKEFRRTSAKRVSQRGSNMAEVPPTKRKKADTVQRDAKRQKSTIDLGTTIEVPDTGTPRTGADSSQLEGTPDIKVDMNQGPEDLYNATPVAESLPTTTRLETTIRSSASEVQTPPGSFDRKSPETSRFAISPLPATEEDRNSPSDSHFPSLHQIQKISPSSPCLPPRFDATVSFPSSSNMDKLLKMIEASFRGESNDWRLAIRSVGFETEAARLNKPTAGMSTFAEWYSLKDREKDIALFGLFYVYDYPGDDPREKAWVAVLRDDLTGNGKELLIWSPWARPKHPRKGPDSATFHYLQDVPKVQKRLIEWIHPERETLTRVWFGMPKERCHWFVVGNWLMDTLNSQKANLPRTDDELKEAGYWEVKLPEQ
ncbi:hypothetical protein PVAG01_09438 [Phlyctema vagabunda]|uniref:DUF6697 domain-containing protein n=1 Tax=Phlyctema vagabunda TaxID=108571 RepID=A0ABR4P7C8_9HELO